MDKEKLLELAEREIRTFVIENPCFSHDFMKLLLKYEKRYSKVSLKWRVLFQIIRDIHKNDINLDLEVYNMIKKDVQLMKLAYMDELVQLKRLLNELVKIRDSIGYTDFARLFLKIVQ